MSQKTLLSAGASQLSMPLLVDFIIRTVQLGADFPHFLFAVLTLVAAAEVIYLQIKCVFIDLKLLAELGNIDIALNRAFNIRNQPCRGFEITYPAL